MVKLTFSLYLLVVLIPAAISASNLLILVLNDLNTRFSRLKYDEFKSFLSGQSYTSDGFKYDVVSIHDKWSSGYIGAWSVLPILNEIHSTYSNNFDYYLFCDVDSRVNLKLMNHRVLNTIDNSVPIFLGHALYDDEPTVTHHYAFHENTIIFPYPDQTACFLLNLQTIEFLADHLNFENEDDSNFVIDWKFELAKKLYDYSETNIKLTNNELFCNHNKRPSDCATWYNWSKPNCQSANESVSNKNVFFAVKTYSGFHTDRVPIIKETWFLDTARNNALFFSDVADSSLPSVYSGPNTEDGHCAKLFYILKYFMENLSKTYKYLVICDDDTLLNVNRLFDLISCFKDEDYFVVGERYGYSVNSKIRQGYNYPTGGAGFVLSTKTVKMILNNCGCPYARTPDDMYIGLCIQYIDKVKFIHTDLMHQARPHDYSNDYLHHQCPISFHKYWNIEKPKEEIYDKWLTATCANQNDSINKKLHNLLDEL